jgi:predicted nucleotidyltransferase component of viral defense system
VILKIPEKFILRWRQNVGWQIPAQVEQDLMISRVLMDLYNEPHVSETLVFKGGTALNKLFLNPHN